MESSIALINDFVDVFVDSSTSSDSHREDTSVTTTPPQVKINNNNNNDNDNTNNDINNDKYTCGWRAEGRNVSGLPAGYFNVLSADKAETLSIPPDLIEPTAGSKNYVAKNHDKGAPTFAFYLCKMYTGGGTCSHGALCDFIHSRHAAATAANRNSRVRAVTVHWSAPVQSMADAAYERHEPGGVLYINSGGPEASEAQLLASEQVYRTRGSEGALAHGAARLLRLCKHYEREKCARGRMCYFIHRVHVDPAAKSSSASSLASTTNATPPTTTAKMSESTRHQVPDVSVMNRRQPPVVTGPRPAATASGPANTTRAQPRPASVISLGPRGEPRTMRGVIMAQSLSSSPQLQLQQQQQTRILTHPAGYSFSPVYTSQQAHFMGNQTTRLSPLPFQPSATFYSRPPPQDPRQQQQQRSSELQRHPGMQMTVTPDYLLPQVLFTFI